MCRKLSFKQFLFYVDLFGSPFNFYIQKDNYKHKTLTGGSYTIIILLSTIIFGSIRIIDWNSGNLPTLIKSYAQTQTSEHTLKMIRNQVNIRVYGFDINENEVYFVPILQQWVGEEISDVKYTLQQHNCTETNSYCLTVEDEQKIKFQQVINSKNNSQNIDYSIYLYHCSKELIQNNQVCASDEKKAKFFSGNTFISIKIQLQQYNNQKQKIDYYDKEYYIYLDELTFQIANILFTYKDLTLKNGYPFTQPKKLEFICDCHIYFQNMKYEQSEQITGLNKLAYLEIYLAIEDNYLVEYIEQFNLIELILIIYNFFRFFYSIGFLLQLRASHGLHKKIAFKQIQHEQTINNLNEKQILEEYFILNNVSNLFKLLKKEKENQVNQVNYSMNQINVNGNDIFYHIDNNINKIQLQNDNELEFQIYFKK